MPYAPRTPLVERISSYLATIPLRQPCFVVAGGSRGQEDPRGVGNESSSITCQHRARTRHMDYKSNGPTPISAGSI
jgi:hypothetical protein